MITDTKAALLDIEWALTNTLGVLHNVTIIRTADMIKLGGAAEVVIVPLENEFVVASSEYKQTYPATDIPELLLGTYTLYAQLVFMKTMKSMKDRPND